jgi:hypothetical protein
MNGGVLGKIALWVTPLAVAALTGYLVVAALSVDPLGCTDPNHEYLPDFGMLAVAGGSVVLGRLLGYLRYQPGWAGWEQRKLTQVAGAIGLCLLLGGAVVALIYEAIGVTLATNFGTPNAQPITYYIRCAIYNDKQGHGGIGLVTLAVLALTGLLVGHWLWGWHSPEREARPTAAMMTAAAPKSGMD